MPEFIFENSWAAILINQDILDLLIVAMIFSGVAMIIRGKRHLAPRAEEVLAKDNRPPVIFLRSFDDESKEFSPLGILRAFYIGILLLLKKRVGLHLSSWSPALQAELAKVMECIGPYIAVGRPGAKLPWTGAARLYIPDNQWQEHIIMLLSKAKLIIIQAGTSEGLQWEIDHVMQLIAPTKLLVILPLSSKRYGSFRSSMSNIGIELPVNMPKSLLMIFDEKWQPMFLCPNGIFEKLEHILEPLFSANKIPTPHTSMWDTLRYLIR